MKKIALMLALVVMGYAVSAQSLNVSSAREAQNRGYLDKAKKLIDAACEHEQTKNDAKTWYYAGLIYNSIGGEAEKPRSKYKDLDSDSLEMNITKRLSPPSRNKTGMSAWLCVRNQCVSSMNVARENMLPSRT